jgi:signal peptidase
MEPAFQRGDILFLTNHETDPVEVGEIVVFKVAGRDIPIVHRVLRAHEHTEGGADYLTKGDNNNIDDRNLYAQGQLWLQRTEMLGRAKASLPYVGMVTILLNDYPALKVVLVGLMGLFVLTSREG